MKSIHIIVIVTLLVVLIACAPIQTPSQPATQPEIPTKEESSKQEPDFPKTSTVDQSEKYQLLMQYNEQKNSISSSVHTIQQTIADIQDPTSILHTLDNAQEEIEHRTSRVLETASAVIKETFELEDFIETNREILKDGGYNPDYEKQQVLKQREEVIEALKNFVSEKTTKIPDAKEPSTKQENNLPEIKPPQELNKCPELSSVQLQGYSGAFQSWMAQASPYKSGNMEIVYSYTMGNVIFCEIGSKEGQNANWVYCGDILRPIVAQYTDNSGIILKKRSVQVIFDSKTNNYVSTQCDAYRLI